VIELSFDADAPSKRGIGIKYYNLLDENNDADKKTGKYGPYATASDVATIRRGSDRSQRPGLRPISSRAQSRKVSIFNSDCPPRSGDLG
jgi:hypothetical protein